MALTKEGIAEGNALQTFNKLGFFKKPEFFFQNSTLERKFLP